MNFNLTWHMMAAQSNLTRPQAGDLGGGIRRKIAALEKRAGKAGNRSGFDLDVTPGN
jgi:hypothetical protein